MMNPWWKGYPWRMVQTNLREMDMQDISAAQFVRDLQAFDATVVLLNTAGIIASYKTDLPFHFQSEYLTGDSLATIIDACHDAGIKVLARTDFSKIRRTLYEAHPDWAFRTAHGDIIDYEGDVHACVMGDYQQKCMPEIVMEALDKLPLDGLFLNMGGFVSRDYSHRTYGPCHCDACKKAFFARFSMALPQKDSMDDPAYPAYLVFQREQMGAFNAKLEKMVHEKHPNVAINSVDFHRMESNTEMGRPLPFWQYSASSNTRCNRGVRGRRVVSNTSVDFIGFLYRHIGVGAPQQALRLYQNLANLGNVDYYLMGRLDDHIDRTPYRAIQNIFAFHKAHVEDFEGLDSVADVLVVRAFRWGDAPEERGWIRALTECHVLFDESEPPDLLACPLSKYKVILLPGTEFLPQALCEKLDAYVQNGGIVIASGRVGLYDDNYKTRHQSALSCLGVTRIAGERRDMASSMLMLSADDKVAFTSFADVDAVAVGERYLFQDYPADATLFAKLLPPQPFGPPERCYGGEPTCLPGAVVHPYGMGNAISIPFWPAAFYTREGYENTFFFLRDVLYSLAGLSSTAPDLTPMAEVTLAQSHADGHYLAQIVNTTGHFGTSYFAPVPLHDVVLSLPITAPVQSATSLLDGRLVPFAMQNGRLTLTVGTLHAYEAIRLA